jgi:hypothetical protein
VVAVTREVEVFGREVELDLEEDESLTEHVFLNLDVEKTLAFALLLATATSSMASMSVLIYVFKKELVLAGGFPPVMEFAQLGMLGSLGLGFLAISAVIYRAQNGLPVSADDEAEEVSD